MKDDGSLQKLKELLKNFPRHNDEVVQQSQLDEAMKTNLMLLLTTFAMTNKKMEEVVKIKPSFRPGEDGEMGGFGGRGGYGRMSGRRGHGGDFY